MKLPVIKRGMVQTALGSIFYLISDGRTATETTIACSTTTVDKPPILCFHMSPRSSDEYLEVLPLLSLGVADEHEHDTSDDGTEHNGRVVIAFDLPGYGASENPPRSCSIDEISDACLEAADSILGTSTTTTITNYVTIGSLLGNYFCLSLASRHPERIRAGILTNPWYNPAASGVANSNGDDDKNAPVPDSFVLKDDGSHLSGLHSKRSGWLDNELNLRVVRSEIEYLANRRKRYAKGISIEAEYDFSSAVQSVVEQRENSSDGGPRSEFLCIRGEACATLFDAFGLDGTNRFDEACGLFLPTGSDDDEMLRVETLTGKKSTLNVVNQMPEEFAALCNNFLSDHGL